MRHLRKFNTQTNYNNVKSSLALPNMCLLDDIYEIASEGDEDIVPIEYLQSTGAQWINTGIIGDLNTEIEIKFNATETSGYACGNNDTSSRAISIYIASTGNQRFGDKTYACNLPINTLHTIISNKNGITINGTTYTRTTTTEFTTAAQLYIFKGSTSATTGGKLKVYYFKVKKNGKLIADFIPVHVGNVGYMFDCVSKKLFANAGTGNFTLGQDIVPVEYLQSDGNAYINTKISLYNAKIGIDTTVALMQNTNDRWSISSMYYSNGTYDGLQVGIYNSKILLGLYNHDRTFIPPFKYTYDSNFHKIRLNCLDVGIKFDNEISESNQTSFGSYGRELFLFKRSSNLTSNYNITSRIKETKVYKDNNFLLQDLIPVRIGTVGYMYDKVSHKLFANAGTGSFTCGPEDSKRKITRTK